MRGAGLGGGALVPLLRPSSRVLAPLSRHHKVGTRGTGPRNGTRAHKAWWGLLLGCVALMPTRCTAADHATWGCNGWIPRADRTRRGRARPAPQISSAFDSSWSFVDAMLVLKYAGAVGWESQLVWRLPLSGRWQRYRHLRLPPTPCETGIRRHLPVRFVSGVLACRGRRGRELDETLLRVRAPLP